MQVIAGRLTGSIHAARRLAGSWLAAATLVVVLNIPIFELFPSVLEDFGLMLPEDGSPLPLTVNPGQVVRLWLPERETSIVRASSAARFGEGEGATTVPVAWQWDGVTASAFPVVPYFDEEFMGALDASLSGTLESETGETYAFERPLQVRVVRDGEGGPMAASEWDADDTLFLLDLFALAAVTALIYHAVSRNRTLE